MRKSADGLSPVWKGILTQSFTARKLSNQKSTANIVSTTRKTTLCWLRAEIKELQSFISIDILNYISVWRSGRQKSGRNEEGERRVTSPFHAVPALPVREQTGRDLCTVCQILRVTDQIILQIRLFSQANISIKNSVVGTVFFYTTICWVSFSVMFFGSGYPFYSSWFRASLSFPSPRTLGKRKRGTG